jgi:hypothetical protein
MNTPASGIFGSKTGIPLHLQWLFVGFLLASLAHFAHNAEYIAYYPGMPRWLTREYVYLAWVGQTLLGLASLWLCRRGAVLLGSLLMAAYGGLGLDGLLHYTLALCSEHTLATNITIFSEATLGLLLLCAAAVFASRHITRPASF